MCRAVSVLAAIVGLPSDDIELKEILYASSLLCYMYISSSPEITAPNHHAAQERAGQVLSYYL